MTRTELVAAFDAIYVLSTKIDRNQGKVNMLHYMHGRADDAFHWQSFVDNQRARVALMLKTFAEATKDMTVEEVSEIKMEVLNNYMKFE